MQNVEHTIRERAYQLWIDGGCKHGDADTHWLAAQREVLSASLPAIGSGEILTSRTSKKPTSRKKRRAA